MNNPKPEYLSLNLSHNTRILLLHLLRYGNGNTYRSQLAAEMKVSATTITNIVDDLMQMNLVEERGLYYPEGEKRLGRPRSSISLVPDALYVVGVHIGAWAYRIAITNMKAEPVYHVRKSIAKEQPPESFMEQIAGEIAQAITASNIPRDRILGVGVGAAGIVDNTSGVVKLFPNLGWTNIPVQAYLEEHLNLPTVVDNNVRAMALSEALFGIGRNARSLVFIFIRAGVGAGIVVKQRMLTSSNVSSVELGHSIIMAEGGQQCRCGNNGCLETLVSEEVLHKMALKIANDNPQGALATRLNNAANQKPVLHLFDAVRDGDEQAMATINQTGRYLGYATSNLVNIINPEMIIFGGTIYDGFDLFLPIVQDTVRDTAFARLGSDVQLAATSFGRHVGVIGGATLALANFLYLHPEEC